MTANTTTPSSETTAAAVPLQLDLRDWFAGQALAGNIRPKYDGNYLTPKEEAETAYAIADAMLAERSKTKEG